MIWRIRICLDFRISNLEFNLFMRINQYLASCGIGSRRKVEELILKKQVKINNRTAILSDQVSEQDAVFWNKKLIKPQTKVIYLFHKPKNVACSLVSQDNDKCITDYIPQNFPKLFPVGRLDKEATGLVLLTNDGDLAQELTHPKFQHEKEYIVKVHSSNPKFLISHLSLLTHLDETKLAPFKISQIDIQGHQAKFNLILTQGLNHQIRRMCDRVGLTVSSIHRIRIDKYLLGDIEAGKIKEVN